MGLESTHKCLITLTRQDENLIIAKIKENQPECTEKYHLSSFFSLLEDSLCKNQLSYFKEGLLKITILDLSCCDLSELPKSFKLLHLKVLNVSNNKLQKTPSCLYAGGLRSLQSLDLSHNLIREFDIEPDCVLNLKCLKLNNNLFTNIPRWFLTFRCTSLEELDYSENKAIHYNFLKHSCNFSALYLKKLVLKSSCLIDVDFSWLKLCRNLEYLDISNGYVTKSETHNKFKNIQILFTKPSWVNLRVLHLSNLGLAFIPEELYWISSLTELYVSHNLLSWFPEGIEYLENLQILDVSHNELILLPKTISQLGCLKVLIANSNHMDEIPPMPGSLEVLDVYDNYITHIDMDSLSYVKHMDLDGNYFAVDCDEYKLKQDSFRNLYNKTDRTGYTKVPDNTEQYFSHSFYSSSDSDLDCGECQEVSENTQTVMHDDEDWNTEYAQPYWQRNHLGINLSDEEFTGQCEQMLNVPKPSIHLQCEDEDWIFEDAD